MSSKIGSTFEHHGSRLEELQARASEALARAHTRWNRKESAESEIQRHKRSVSWLKAQISQLSCRCPGPCCCNVEARRSNLESRLRDAENDLRCARSDLCTAENLLDSSRGDWRDLRQKEDHLNESTSHRLKVMPLWSLKDTGNVITENLEDIGDWLSETWDFIKNELLPVLYEILSKLLDYLDIAGLVLEWIPVVNVVFKAVEILVVATKALAGLGMVLAGHITLSEFLIDTAIDAAGIAIPGGRRIAKGIKKVLKNGSMQRILGSIPKRIDAGVKGGLRLPVIKHFNEWLYKRSDGLYRPRPMRFSSEYTHDFPSFMDHMDEVSWITRKARERGFVKVDVLSPVGKTSIEFGTDRVFEMGKDQVGFWSGKWLSPDITYSDSRDTPHQVLVPFTCP